MAAQAGRGGGGAKGGQGGAGREGSGAGSTGGRDSAMGGRESKTGQRGAGALSSIDGTFGQRADVRAGKYDQAAKALGTDPLGAATALASANNEFNNRSFLDKAFDFALGPFYDVSRPTLPNPRSFSGGTTHSYSNPGGIAGLALGLATGLPGLGTIGSYGYEALGAPMVYHGGYGPQSVGGSSYGGSSSSRGALGGGNPRQGGGGALGTFAPQASQPVPQQQLGTSVPQPVPPQPGLLSMEYPGGNVNIAGPSPYSYYRPTYRYYG